MASVAILDVTHHPIIPTGTRGRKMPAREPLPARCVVIAPSREAAIAGRSAGMRVVGLCSEAEVTLDGAVRRTNQTSKCIRSMA